jgi:hypothetical protein
VVVEPGLDLDHGRAEDEDAPEPEHDARDCRQRLHERGDRPAQEARRELGQVERDPDRERRGQRQREE